MWHRFLYSFCMYDVFNIYVLSYSFPCLFYIYVECTHIYICVQRPYYCTYIYMYVLSYIYTSCLIHLYVLSYICLVLCVCNVLIFILSYTYLCLVLSIYVECTHIYTYVQRSYYCFDMATARQISWAFFFFFLPTPVTPTPLDVNRFT